MGFHAYWYWRLMLEYIFSKFLYFPGYREGVYSGECEECHVKLIWRRGLTRVMQFFRKDSLKERTEIICLSLWYRNEINVIYTVRNFSLKSVAFDIIVKQNANSQTVRPSANAVLLRFLSEYLELIIKLRSLTWTIIESYCQFVSY